jgi:hypothetical protein
MLERQEKGGTCKPARKASGMAEIEYVRPTKTVRASVELKFWLSSKPTGDLYVNESISVDN